MNPGDWTSGNRLQLLENGEEYFPAVFAAIEAARKEVLIETFILFDDDVGRALHEVLRRAGERGLRVVITVDGYGSPDLPDAFVQSLTAAGVEFRYYDPRPRLLGLRTNALGRLHRKLVAIDAGIAFIGGLNFAEDHLRTGPDSKQDYGLRIDGPAAAHIRALIEATRRDLALPRQAPWRLGRRRQGPPQTQSQDGAVRLIWRDHEHHRDDIEVDYRLAIRHAQREICIANAYFLPGHRLLRELRRAAQRGLRVVLILQGMPDQVLLRWAASQLYGFLMANGVQIYEYCERAFHGKVAVVDEDWSTIGSSNLDPSSLALNLEANLVIVDRRFNALLRERLQGLIREECRKVLPAQLPRRTLLRQLASYLVFHFVRRYPAWARRLPTLRRRSVAAEMGAPGPDSP